MTAARRVHHDPTPAPTEVVRIEPPLQPVGVLPFLAGVLALIPAGMLIAYLMGGAA